MATPETYFPLEPARAAYLTSFVWYSQGKTGYPWVLFTALPFTAALALLRYSLGSLALAQRLWTGLILATAATSMYWLILILLGRRRFASLGALCGALFYTLNPFFAYTFHWLPAYPLALALLPLAMALYAQGLRTAGRSSLYRILPSALVLALAAPVAMNLPLYLVSLIAFVAFMVAELVICHPMPMRAVIGQIGLFGVAHLALNLWWILPLGAEWRSSYGATHLNPGTVQGTLFSSPMSRSFSLLLYYWLDKSWQGLPNSPYYAYAGFYFQLFGTLALFAVSFLAFSVLTFKNRPRSAVYFAGLALIGVVLGQGSASWMGGVYRWLMLHVPGFVAFRSSDIKFPLWAVLGYAPLLGFALAKIAGWLQPWSTLKPGRSLITLTAGVVAIVSCLWIGWPVLTGAIVRSAVGDFPGDRMQPIPNYWEEAVRWLDAQPKTGRVLSLPKSERVPDWYEWGYFGPSLLESISRQTVINASAEMDGYSLQEQEFFGVAQALYASLEEGQAARFRNLLDLLSVGYVVYRSDLDSRAGAGLKEQLRFELSFLDDVPGLSRAASFGKLQIFRVDHPAPRISAAPMGKPASSPPGQASGGDTGLASNWCATPQAAYSRGVSDESAGYEPAPGRVNLSVSEINPTRYNVRVNSEVGFCLLFNESFHPGWTAYLVRSRPAATQRWYDGSALLTWLVEGRQRIELPSHFQVLTYANGWHVLQVGEHTITIEFVPQRLFEVGLLISVAIFFIGTSYLVCQSIRRRGT